MKDMVILLNKIKKLAAAILAALCLTVTVSAQAAVYEGIDVSVWQGGIDFVQVRSSGREIVYIRAGYGLSEDSTFRRNAVNARDAGMKIGFYFYVTAADTAQARRQAEFFASLIREYDYDCRPAVDFEQFGELSSGELNAIALAFSGELESATGITPLFYTDGYSTENLWYDSLAKYPLWVADYGVESPPTGPWGEWAGFQYYDMGRVPGITGNVDLDSFTEAVLIRDPQSELPFYDVRTDDWFYGAVLDLYKKGLIRGTSGDFFSPDAPAERDMAVSVLYRIEGSPAVTGGSDFTDVDYGAWYADAVIWAGQAEIANGYGDGLFYPYKAATRQEMAVLLYRYASYKGYDVSKTSGLEAYTDAGEIADWALDAVKWAVGEGIINGTGTSTLSPEQTADRAQMAVMFDRFLTIEGI